MTGSLPGFGGQGYVSQESRALSTVEETPGPDLSQGQEAAIRMLQGHDSQIKFLASELKKAQKGVNEANQNPIQQLQQFIADVIILLGGGELAEGALDFGDLQYILPALGALFGFGDGPFPLSLFEAAEKFFLGYVVPQQQFVDVINGIIQAWLGLIGIDPKFIKDVKALVTALGDLFDGINNLFPSLDQLFSSLGISAGDLGPLGQVLGPVLKLFTGLDLKNFGNMIEFITDAIGPFIEQLTAVINFINGILAVMGFDGDGGVVNSPIGDTTLPFANLVGLLGDINFASPDFDPVAALEQFVTYLLTSGLFPGVGDLIENLLNGGQPVNVQNLFGQIPSFLLGKVSASSITSTNPNLLNNGGFDGSISMDALGGWTYDAATGHTTNGSAKVTANGTLLALLSNAIDVSPGQVLTPSAWVKSSSYTGSGTPIRIGLRTYLHNDTTGASTAVSTPIIASSAGPGSSWAQLSGTYTVPSDGTVNQVRLRLIVDTTATGGTIWFDDGSLVKPGNGPFDGVLQLFNLSTLGDLQSGLNVTAIWQAIITAFLNPSGLLQDAASRLKLFGGSTPLDQILPGAYAGVSSGAGTGLLTDVQTFLGVVYGGLTNQSGSNASLGAVGQATASTADAVAGQGAMMTQLLAALSTGTSDADDFERSSVGSDWFVGTSSGAVSIPDSHNLHFSGTGSSAEFVMRRLKPSAGDRMTSIVSLNQAIPTYFFLPVPYGGYVDVWVRCTAFTTFATRSGVRLRFNSTGLAATWVLANVVNGAVTATLQSGSCAIPAGGGFLALEAGAGGTSNRYLGTLSGNQIGCDFTDSGGVTTIGATARWRGLGGQGNSGVGTAQGTPDIRQWGGG